MNAESRKRSGEEIIGEVLGDPADLSDDDILEKMQMADLLIDDSAVPPPPEDWDKRLVMRLERELKKRDEWEKRSDRRRRRKIRWFCKPEWV